MKNAAVKRPRVGLFVTCLVDAMRPNIGFATLKLLEQAGCDVEVPMAQSCCGQSAFNSGDYATTRAIAQQIITTFEAYDYVVVPSGWCASTIRTQYRDVFGDAPDWIARQSALAAKTWEVMSFLSEVMGFAPADVRCDGVATDHASRSGLRDLGGHNQPRDLLARVAGLNMVPLVGNDACCGFGGTFCADYPDISNAIQPDFAGQRFFARVVAKATSARVTATVAQLGTMVQVPNAVRAYTQQVCHTPTLCVQAGAPTAAQAPQVPVLTIVNGTNNAADIEAKNVRSAHRPKHMHIQIVPP